MSFREELTNIDTEKIEDIFDDLFPTQGSFELPVESREFIEQEVALGDVKYPVFQSIFNKFKDIAPTILQSGMSEERVHGIFMGLVIGQLVLSNYAETEIPDSPPWERDSE